MARKWSSDTDYIRWNNFSHLNHSINVELIVILNNNISYLLKL